MFFLISFLENNLPRPGSFLIIPLGMDMTTPYAVPVCALLTAFLFQ